jgi:hypothetical protein
LAIHDYLVDFERKKRIDRYSLLEQLGTWYDGYRFSKANIKVYNPFSVLYCLKDQEFNNYWFESGTPFFLIPLLKKEYTSLKEVAEFEISLSSLGTFDLEHIPLVPLLFQTGYITITDYNQETNKLKLGYANFEVEESFKKCLVAALSYASTLTIDTTLSKLIKALKEQDLHYFCSTLEQLLAHIPYTLHIEKESYYHSLFQFLMSLLSLESQSEMLTDRGRIDAVLSMPDRIYIFELKLHSSADDALQQILERQYYQRFLTQYKPLTLVGLSFGPTAHKFTVTYAAQEMHTCSEA